MRLSIFSFNSFLRNALLSVLVMTTVYVVAIELLKPDIVFTQNQYQANTIFAQDFIYLDKKPSNIIVGSSMAQRMKFGEEADVYNLAFGGGGPLSGLAIVRQSGFVPQKIYIESNVFTMELDETFINSLFPPILFELRAHVSALQEKYQVMNLVGTFMYRMAGRSQDEILQHKVDNTLLDKLVMEALASKKALIMDHEALLLQQWHEQIDYFKSRGTEVVFFEMPVDPRFVKTPAHEQLRVLIKDAFPQVRYIEENNANGIYKTADGTHLILQSSKDFSKYFKQMIMDDL